MYLPKDFAVEDRETLYGLIRANSDTPDIVRTLADCPADIATTVEHCRFHSRALRFAAWRQMVSDSNTITRQPRVATTQNQGRRLSSRTRKRPAQSV